MQKIQSQIEINAPAEQVWQILTDFAAFPQWNPFIPRISGEAKRGGSLEVRLQAPDSVGMTLRPTVLEAEPNREFRWVGRLVIPGLFAGEHSWTLEPLGPNRVRFIQHETFTGLLVPFFRRILTATLRGFEEMNQALKVRAEHLPA